MVDKHAPLLEDRVKKAKQSEWFSEDIKQAMFFVTHMHPPMMKKIWNIGEKRPLNLCVKLSQHIIVNLLMLIWKKGKKRCELIRELSPKTSSDTTTNLSYSNKTIIDSKDTAESFNDFCENISQFLTENMTMDRQPLHDISWGW